jgi:hypothetical protein
MIMHIQTDSTKTEKTGCENSLNILKTGSWRQSGESGGIRKKGAGVTLGYV